MVGQGDMGRWATNRTALRNKPREGLRAGDFLHNVAIDVEE
jgi:hypothetical protein